MDWFFKEITGRFKELSEDELISMRESLVGLIDMCGGVSGGTGNTDILPLWAEVEFLDNVVKFEMERNPYLVNGIN